MAHPNRLSALVSTSIRVALMAMLLLVLPQVSCAPAPVTDTAGPAQPPSILLLTVDTLRTDHLSFNGYPRPTSPFLDSLRSQGASFTRAYSTSSWTVPALATLATGLYPPSHGVVHGTGMSPEGRPRDQEAISPELPSMAAELQKRGYRTYGIVANLHGHEDFGFGRGFDRYRCVGFSDAPAVHELLIEWRDDIAAASADGPVFVWLHYFDPHWPYQDRRPWSRQFTPDLPEDALRQCKNLASSWTHGVPPSIIQNLGQTLEYARTLYDSEISYVDDFIRRAFAILPMMADWFTVISADHGEEFLDHGELGHSMNLFDETVRVPLVLRGKGIPEGQTIESVVSLVDIPPTLVTVAGGHTPEGWQGTALVTPDGSLRSDLPGDRVVLAFLDRDENRRHRRALIGPRFKLITGLGHEKRWLYDLVNDPGEHVELSGVEPHELEGLTVALEAALAALPPPPEDIPSVMLTTEQAEQLKRLGYVAE